MTKVQFIIVLVLVFIGCASIPTYRNLNEKEELSRQFCEVKYKFFKPTNESIAVDYRNKTYFLCCNECKNTFDKNINKYIKENGDNEYRGYRQPGACH